MSNDDLLGLGLPWLDAQFADVELAAAPPVWPADDRVLLPAQLHDHQVADVHIGGDEEGQSGVTFQDRPVGWKEEQTFKGQLDCPQGRGSRSTAADRVFLSFFNISTYMFSLFSRGSSRGDIFTV